MQYVDTLTTSPLTTTLDQVTSETGNEFSPSGGGGKRNRKLGISSEFRVFYSQIVGNKIVVVVVIGIVIATVAIVLRKKKGNGNFLPIRKESKKANTIELSEFSEILKDIQIQKQIGKGNFGGLNLFIISQFPQWYILGFGRNLLKLH